MSSTYTKTISASGNCRLAVMMADNKGSDIYEIFYTYKHIESSGSYTRYPTSINDDILGSLSTTAIQYYYVITSIGNVPQKELLATYTQTVTYNYVLNDGNVIPIIVSDTGCIGTSIDTVSNQITGDYIAHTYRFKNAIDNTILNRKVRITRISTGEIFNFTEENLGIRDTSPIGSTIERWELLTAIGINSLDITV